MNQIQQQECASFILKTCPVSIGRKRENHASKRVMGRGGSGPRSRVLNYPQLRYTWTRCGCLESIAELR